MRNSNIMLSHSHFYFILKCLVVMVIYSPGCTYIQYTKCMLYVNVCLEKIIMVHAL